MTPTFDGSSGYQPIVDGQPPSAPPKNPSGPSESTTAQEQKGMPIQRPQHTWEAKPNYLEDEARATGETLTPLPTPTLPTAPTFTTVQEQNRTYTFPTGKVALEGVVDINVSKSGTHRINTKDGKKHIVPPGWIHIEFDAPHWTF